MPILIWFSRIHLISGNMKSNIITRNPRRAKLPRSRPIHQGLIFPLYKKGAVPTPTVTPSPHYLNSSIDSGDYDGDGRSDLALYSETTGDWLILYAQNGRIDHGNFGGPYLMPVPGDYDGDGKADPTVYHRVSGLWMVLFSTSHSAVSGVFGGNGFVPVPTDYDGDGLTDPAIYATESGYWYILPSTTLTSQGYSLAIYQFGGTAMSTTLVPAPGNYDGVGSADLGLYDTTTWCWYIMTLDGVPLAWGYPMGRLGYLPVLP